jgi:hypothetical protein
MSTSFDQEAPAVVPVSLSTRPRRTAIPSKKLIDASNSATPELTTHANAVAQKRAHEQQQADNHITDVSPGPAAPKPQPIQINGNNSVTAPKAPSARSTLQPNGNPSAKRSRLGSEASEAHTEVTKLHGDSDQASDQESDNLGPKSKQYYSFYLLCTLTKPRY